MKMKIKIKIKFKKIFSKDLMNNIGYFTISNIKCFFELIKEKRFKEAFEYFFLLDFRKDNIKIRVLFIETFMWNYSWLYNHVGYFILSMHVVEFLFIRIETTRKITSYN